MRQLCLLILGALVLISCRKGNEEVRPPLVGALAGEYQSGSSIIAAAPITMYTATGQINNAALVDRFLTRHLGTSAPIYFSRTDVPITNGSVRTITLEANDQTTEVQSLATTRVTSKAVVTSRTPQYLVLTGVDSVAILSGINFLPNPCALKGEMVRTTSSVKVCRPLPLSTGYSQTCKHRPVQALGLRYGQLYIPALSWILKSSTTRTLANPTTHCTYAVGNQREVFNPAVLNQLATDDTLVVQSREIALIKK
jgi:hypothetical protein